MPSRSKTLPGPPERRRFGRPPRAVALALAAGLGALALAGCGQMLESSSAAPPMPAIPAASANAASRFTTVSASPDGPSLRLHTEEEGAGPPLLLIHGFGASAYSFRAIRGDLAKSNHVIAVDLKGFGQSDKPLDDAYAATDQARLLVDLIERRNLKDVTVGGHSFGGAVALALALELNRKHPGRLKRLLLIDGVAYEQGLPPALHVLRTPYLGPASAAIVPPEVQSTAALLLAYADSTKVTKEAITAYARPMYEPGNRHALVRTAEKIIPEYINIVTHQYRSIKQPVLLIWCRADKIVPLRIGQRLALELPDARLEVLDTCGHVPQEEEPARTAALIAGFVKP